MKFFKVGKEITESPVVVDIEPNFEAFREVIGCNYIELHKMGKYMIILDDEGALKTGNMNNMGMFAGDLLIGIDGVYDWKYELLENPSKSEFIEIDGKDIDEISGAVSFIKILNLGDNIDSVIMEYSFNLFKKYGNLFEEGEDTMTIYKTMRRLGRAIIQNEENFTLKERFFIDYIFKNFI